MQSRNSTPSPGMFLDMSREVAQIAVVNGACAAWPINNISMTSPSQNYFCCKCCCYWLAAQGGGGGGTLSTPLDTPPMSR